MKKRITAIVISVLMVVSMLPFSVFAETAHVHSNECPGKGADHNKDNCVHYAKVEEEPVVAPGCCTYGYTLYECLDCHTYFASDIVAPTAEDDCAWKSLSDFVAPTCTTDGAWAKYECSVGGAVKYTDAENNIVNPASDEAKKAITMLGHDYGNLIDCHEGLVCKREGCDFFVDAKDHTWECEDIADSKIVIDEPSTLHKDGKFHYECGVCGAKSPLYVIHAHEHDYVAQAGTPASCKAAGVKAHFTCSVEGCEMLFVLVDNDYVATTAAALVIDVLPHTYVDEGDEQYDYDAYNTFIDNTCKTSGYTLRKCTVCEKWIEENQTPIDPEKHTWEVIEAAEPGDCETEGKSAVEYCKVCRIVRGGDVVAGTGKGHNKVTVKVDSTCTKQGYTYTYCTNPFCTLEKITLTVNNEEVAKDLKVLPDTFKVFDLNPDAHTLGWVITEEATCVAPGHKIWACTSCEGEGTATGAYAPIPVDTVNGHNWVKDSDPTCTAPAKGHCTICGSTSYPDAAAALGHTSLLPDGTQSPVLTKYPHCKANGTGTNGYTYQLCQRCGTAEMNKTTVLYNTSYIYDNEVDAKNQHDLKDGYKKLYKEGNCSAQGLWTLGECAHCNRTVLLTMEGTGKGHKMPTTGVVNPTCTEKGGYTCQNDWCENENKYVEIPALEHDLTEVAAKDPTCTEAGWKAYFKCTRTGCDAKFAQESTFWDIHANGAAYANGLESFTANFPYYEFVFMNQTSIDPDGAEDGAYLGTYNGVTAVFVIADGAFVTILEQGDPTLAALEHEVNDDLTNTADCDEFGYRIEYCLRCASHDMYDYVAVLGHDMTKESVFTSCVTDKIFVCNRDGCDHTVVDEGTAPGHENSDGDFFWEGCLDTEDNRYCVVCKDTISNEHDLYVEIDDAAPTCTQPGYDLVACKTCDYEEIIINVDPLGHDWIKDGECEDKSTAPTFSAGGSYHYCCSRCDECKDVPQDILTGVAFDMTVENAVLEGAEIVDSTIIAVNVSMKSLKVDIWGYQFDVDYDANNLTYLGYTYNNADFNIHQVNDNCYCEDHETPYWHYVTVLGYVENTPEGEKQNVTIENSTDIITLYFQVRADYADDDLSAWIEIDEEWIDVRNADEELVDAVGDLAEVEIDTFADANGDWWATVADVQYAYYIATGLYEDITYDSCVDINKDGWITAADVRLMADLATGAADYEDLYEADEWERPEGFVSAA